MVSPCDVDDMDIISDAAAIWGRISVAIDRESLSGEKGVDEVGNEVGLWLMVFADLAARIGPRGIKKTEYDIPKFRIFCRVRSNELFGEPLGLAIGRGGSDRIIFSDGKVFGLAKTRATGGKNQPFCPRSI